MRKFIAILLALTLCLGIAMPTSAAGHSVSPGYKLSVVEASFERYGSHYFHDGYVPVLTDEGWRYLTTEGKIVDFGMGNFIYVFDFSEGYAPFITMDFKLGYMDTEGNFAAFPIYDFYSSMGTVYAGRVIDGHALVYDADSGEFETITMDGSAPSITLDPDDENVLYSDVFGNTEGVEFETVEIDGVETEVGFSEGYALDFAYDVSTDEYGDEVYTSVPVIITRDNDALKPISIHFDDDYFMSDYGPVNSVTLRNNTKEHVKGAYTLLLYKDRLSCSACNGSRFEKEHIARPSALIYSIDLDLAPGESYTGEFYFNTEWNLATTGFMFVEYDDAAERAQYLSSDALSFDASFEDPAEGYHGYWRVMDKSYLEAFPYGIDFKPFTHK